MKNLDLGNCRLSMSVRGLSMSVWPNSWNFSVVYHYALISYWRLSVSSDQHDSATWGCHKIPWQWMQPLADVLFLLTSVYTSLTFKSPALLQHFVSRLTCSQSVTWFMMRSQADLEDLYLSGGGVSVDLSGLISELSNDLGSFRGGTPFAFAIDSEDSGTVLACSWSPLPLRLNRFRASLLPCCEDSRSCLCSFTPDPSLALRVRRMWELDCGLEPVYKCTVRACSTSRFVLYWLAGCG